MDTLAGLADGSFTSESLTLAYLEAIAKYEDSYNAFTFLSPDAVSDAIASDMKRAAGAQTRVSMRTGSPCHLQTMLATNASLSACLGLWQHPWHLCLPP